MIVSLSQVFGVLVEVVFFVGAAGGMVGFILGPLFGIWGLYLKERQLFFIGYGSTLSGMITVILMILIGFMHPTFDGMMRVFGYVPALAWVAWIMFTCIVGTMMTIFAGSAWIANRPDKSMLKLTLLGVLLMIAGLVSLILSGALTIVL